MAVTEKKEKKDYSIVEKKQEDSNIFTDGIENEGTGVAEKLNSIPADEVQKMMEDMRREFSQKMEQMKRDMDVKSIKSDIASNENRSADILEDYLEEPVSFFSYLTSYSIHGDIRHGKESLPPNGAIKFKPLFRSKRNTPRGIVVISTSVVKIQSKSQLDWLRKSPLFGVTFFETPKDTLTVDPSFADMIVQSSQEVGRMNDYTVISRCEAMGIPKTTDLDLMRKKLTEKLAESKKSRLENHHKAISAKIQNMQDDGTGKITELKEGVY